MKENNIRRAITKFIAIKLKYIYRADENKVKGKNENLITNKIEIISYSMLNYRKRWLFTKEIIHIRFIIILNLSRIAEVIAWFNVSESDAVESSKLLVGLPSGLRSNTRNQD